MQKKCQVKEMGGSNRRPTLEDKLTVRSKEEKHPGVVIQDALSPEKRNTQMRSLPPLIGHSQASGLHLPTYIHT